MAEVGLLGGYPTFVILRVGLPSGCLALKVYLYEKLPIHVNVPAVFCYTDSGDYQVAILARCLITEASKKAAIEKRAAFLLA